MLLILLLLPVLTDGLVGAIYCGDQNCYDVLKVRRDADRSQIRKAYYELARKHHPDKQKTVKNKEEAEVYFRLINTAYEILSDPEQRQDYDYMLDNPDQLYMNYYRYYRRRYTPKVDVRIVLLTIVLIISAIQYMGQRTSYTQALNYLLKDPKHRARAKQLANAEGLLNISKRNFGKRLTRDELKEREEELLRTFIEETVELRGDCSKPTLRRVLLIQLLVLPWTVLLWMYWVIHWVINYWILRKPYDGDAQIFLTRRRLGLTVDTWEGLPIDQQTAFLNKQLWINENYQRYISEQAEQTRIQSAENSQYKRFRRYMKRAGPAQVNLENL